MRRSEAARSDEIAAPVERSEVPLCEVPMDKTGWARRAVCALYAGSVLLVLLRGCLRRPRARARGLLYFCRKR